MMNPRSRDWAEKRDFIRMKVNTEVTITVEASNQKIMGVCRDLSGNGMLLEANQPIAEGQTCRTSLNTPSAALPSLNAELKVIRCTQLGEDRYQLGTEIIQID